MVNWEEIHLLVTFTNNIGTNCLNNNISGTIEKTVVHLDIDFRDSFLLCASNMKILFTKENAIAINYKN